LGSLQALILSDMFFVHDTVMTPAPKRGEVPGPNILTGEVDKRYQSEPSRRGHAVKLSGRAPETLLVGLYEDVAVPEFPVLVVRLHAV
jgi:hypothetical protein